MAVEMEDLVVKYENEIIDNRQREQPKIHKNYIQELDKEISEEEFECALKELKDGKAARNDGIPIELIKNAPEEYNTEIKELIRYVGTRESN